MPTKTQVSTPTTTTTTGPATAAGGQGPNRQPAGNGAAAQDVKGKVGGPLGRVWNRILGQPESADTSNATVDQAMIRAYLDSKLQLAEGEMFRGKKLDGVAENLMKTFDKDGDARLTWPEFQGFQSTLLAMLAPETAAGSQDAATSAPKEHGVVDEDKDGKAGMSEIQSRAKDKLPSDTSYKDLVAQLGARVAIDAADKDEGGKPVSERSLSKTEWTNAAKELGARK